MKRTLLLLALVAMMFPTSSAQRLFFERTVIEATTQIQTAIQRFYQTEQGVTSYSGVDLSSEEDRDTAYCHIDGNLVTFNVEEQYDNRTMTTTATAILEQGRIVKAETEQETTLLEYAADGYLKKITSERDGGGYVVERHLYWSDGNLDSIVTYENGVYNLLETFEYSSDPADPFFLRLEVMEIIDAFPSSSLCALAAANGWLGKTPRSLCVKYVERRASDETASHLSQLRYDAQGRVIEFQTSQTDRNGGEAENLRFIVKLNYYADPSSARSLQLDRSSAPTSYDLYGRRANAQSKGLILIKNADGTMRKTLR